MPNPSSTSAAAKFPSLESVTQAFRASVARHGGFDDALAGLLLSIYPLAKRVDGRLGTCSLRCIVDPVLARSGGSISHAACADFEESIEQVVINCVGGPEEEGEVLLAIFDALLHSLTPLTKEEDDESSEIAAQREEFKLCGIGSDPSAKEWERYLYLDMRQREFGTVEHPRTDFGPMTTSEGPTAVFYAGGAPAVLAKCLTVTVRLGDIEPMTCTVDQPMGHTAGEMLCEAQGRLARLLTLQHRTLPAWANDDAALAHEVQAGRVRC